MTRFLNRKQKVFRSMVGVLIYCMVGIPIFTSIDISFAEPATTSMERFQLSNHPANTSFRTAQAFPEVFDKKTKPAEETVKLSKKEKKKLVEKGVTQYNKGELSQAKKTLEQAKAVFPSNYAVPYYLGLIYLEEGRRSDAIAEWQQYILMDPNSEDSMKIRKYLTLLIHKEAVDQAKQAVANEAALLSGPVADNTVAVTAFKNLGSENLGPLGKGMAAMLIHDLSQVPDLQVVERVKIQALLKEMNLGTSGLVDEKTAPKVGKLLRSEHVTTGSLYDLKKKDLQIFSVLVDTKQAGKIDTREVQGALKEFYDLEKAIACGIIEDLGRNCSKMPGAFYKIHTKSLAALTAFSVGLDYLDQEKYDEARDAFQKALDEDPNFGLAKKALLATPLSAMALMTTSQMISTLSASGVSSTALGTATAGTAAVGAGGGVGVVGITTGVIVGAAAVAGIAVAAGGGGGGDDSIAPTPTLTELNVTGVWVGTGSNNSEISLDLTQKKGSTSVSGSASIAATGCTFSGTLDGVLEGKQFKATITGSDTASINANVTSSSINGTLEITSGSCAGTIASFAVSITGGGIISW